MVWDMLRRGLDPVQISSALITTSTRPSSDAMAQQDVMERGPNLTARTARLLMDSRLRMPTAEIAARTAGTCGTQKLLIRLQDGHEVETVLIPSDVHTSSRRARTTLCVSR
jgi:adenine C2-methylase RlmN of 23S rRNA A2503 and tRNA A37